MTVRRTLLLVAILCMASAREVHAQSCSYTVLLTSIPMGSTGGTRNVSVQSGIGCPWSATSQTSWITVAPSAGTAIGTVVVTVEPNPGATQRTGTVTIAGYTVTVTQAANSCSYMLAPSSLSVPASESAQSVNVSTGTACTWTAVPSVEWITITGGGTGSAFGLVSFTVAANPAGAIRTGTISIGNKTFTVTQAAGSGPPPPSVPSGLRIVS
jgi:hypothetical protein